MWTFSSPAQPHRSCGVVGFLSSQKRGEKEEGASPFSTSPPEATSSLSEAPPPPPIYLMKIHATDAAASQGRHAIIMVAKGNGGEEGWAAEMSWRLLPSQRSPSAASQRHTMEKMTTKTDAEEVDQVEREWTPRGVTNPLRSFLLS